MTYESFIAILTTYQKLQQDFYKLADVGFDFYEGKFQLVAHAEKLLEEAMRSHYNDFGWDWISWFIWENDYGKKKLGAWDADGKPVAQNSKKLHKMLEKEYKNGAAEHTPSQ